MKGCGKGFLRVRSSCARCGALGTPPGAASDSLWTGWKRSIAFWSSVRGRTAGNMTTKTRKAGPWSLRSVQINDAVMRGPEKRKATVIPLLLDGTHTKSLPPCLHDQVFSDFRKSEDYFDVALDLLLSLFGIGATEQVRPSCGHRCRARCCDRGGARWCAEKSSDLSAAGGSPEGCRKGRSSTEISCRAARVQAGAGSHG